MHASVQELKVEAAHFCEMKMSAATSRGAVTHSELELASALGHSQHAILVLPTCDDADWYICNAVLMNCTSQQILFIEER